MTAPISRRIHGRNARIYVGLASPSATASPVSFQTKWAISFTTDKVDVTALGDDNKVYVAGLPDAQGTTEGWYDTASDQTYTAAQDGQPRKMYLYPTVDDATYWFGTALFDFSVTPGVSDGVAVSSGWNAASPIIKVNAA